MGKKTKKFLVVLLALVMCFALALSLVACKDEEKEQKEKPFDTTLAQQYSTEIAQSLAKTIKSANLADGFKLNLGLNIKVNKTSETEDDTNLSVSIVGNVLDNATTANNDFRIEVKNGENLVFGMYNDGTSLGIKAGGEVFHFKDASIMKVLKLALTRYAGDTIPDSLGDIAIEGQGLDTLLSAMLPAALQTLCAYGPTVLNTQQIAITLDNGKYVFDIQTNALKGLLSEAIGGLDTSFIPADAVIKCTLEKTTDGAVKNLTVKIVPSDNSYTTDVNVTSPSGWFTAVDAEFDAEMPTEISDKTATNLLTAEVNSTIKFVANDGTILRNMTMDFKIDMNPLVLLENELTSENIKKLGYFILNVKAGDQPLIGLAFDPANTGTDSVYVYLQLATNNDNLTTGLNKDNYILGTEINISTLVDSLIFKKPSATFKPTVDDPIPDTDLLSASSQMAELPLDMIFGLLSSIIPELNITEDQIGYINDMIDSIVPVRDETASASGLDINVQNFMANLGRLVGDENILTKPLIDGTNLSIPQFLFGTGLDGDKAIGSIELRTADDAATFNKPITAPTSFNPNNWITSSFANDSTNSAVNEGKGYIKSNTITAEEVTVEYGMSVTDLLKNDLPVSYTGFNGTEYKNVKLPIRNVIGYDPYKVGKQEVLVHLGMSSNLMGILQIIQGMIGVDNIQSYLTFIPVKLTINVLPKVDASAISIEYGDPVNATGEAVYQAVGGSANKVLAGFDPVIKIADRSYNLKDNKYLITEYPAEYDKTYDTFKDVGHYNFVIEIAGAKKTFTVKTFKFDLATSVIEGTDLFGEGNENVVSYFNGTTIVEQKLTHENFESATIGRTNFELDDNNRLIIPTQYRSQEATIKFKATVYGKEYTASGKFAIVPTESLAEVSYHYRTSGKAYDLLENVVKLTLYADNELVGKDLPLRNYAKMQIKENKDHTNFSYGFMKNIAQEYFLIDGVTVNIAIFDSARDNDVTSTVYDKGMIIKAGTYDIKITGKVVTDKETIDLTMGESKEIWLDDYVVTEYNDSIGLNVMKGQSLDGERIDLIGLPIAEYPMDATNNRVMLDNFKWDDTNSRYVAIGSYNIPDTYMPTDLRDKIAKVLADGVPIDIEYQDDDGAWQNLCGADGLVSYSGTLTVKKLRFTINWGGGNTGLEAITFHLYNEYRDVTIKAVDYKIAGNKTTVYVNEKLPVITRTAYKNGVKEETTVTADAISSTNGAFNADNYMKLTVAGTQVITITASDLGGITTDITFTVIEAGFSIPASGSTFNIYVDFALVPPSYSTPIPVGTSIYDILVKSSAKFENVSVDENGSVTGGALTAQELINLGITFDIGNSFIIDLGAGKFISLLDDEYKTTAAIDLLTTANATQYISLRLVYQGSNYDYTIKVGQTPTL